MKDKTYIKDLEAVIEHKEQYIQELEETNKQLQERINSFIRKQIDETAKDVANKLRVKWSEPEINVGPGKTKDSIEVDISIPNTVDISIPNTEEIKHLHEHWNYVKQLQEEYGTDSKNNI